MILKKGKNLFFTTALICSTLVCNSSLFAAPTTGVVNFATCITDSKYGAEEQASFEKVKDQFTKLIEGTEKELQTLQTNLEDKEYMDSLTADAEKELKEKFATLNEEMMRYQNQFYQTMNQAQFRVMQNMQGRIAKASEEVGKARKLDLIVNKDQVFYAGDKLDITAAVVEVMDTQYEKEQKEKKKAESTSK